MDANQSASVGRARRRQVARRTESAPPPDRVLRVAERLFLKKGYSATSIREIAAGSRVSNATIVKYFGGKRELFVQVVAEVTARLIGAAAIDFADLPEQGLNIWGAAVLRLTLEPRMVIAARHIYSDVSMLPKLGQNYYEIGPAKLAVNLSLHLKRWAEMERFPEQDFLAAAEWFLHLLSGGVYHRVMIGLQTAASDGEIEETVHEATRIFLAAFGQTEVSP
jgi:TetR/AcrR family transcriptional regulator, mexJK operon transcriptional repressor